MNSTFTTSFGSVTVPRLFLGDHGFLRKLDSTMSDDVVAARMTRMLDLLEVGLAAGEPRVLQAAIRVAERRNSRPALMLHDDINVGLDGERVRYRRCAATVLAALDVAGVELRDDRVLRFLIEVAGTGARLTERETQRLRIDEGALTRLCVQVAASQPSILTVGGDWVDLLLVSGRGDLVLEAFRVLRSVAAASGTVTVLTTYVGALLPDAVLQPILNMVDGLMVPVNATGAAMLPDRQTVLAWIGRAGKPAVAMHVLGGSGDVADAIRFALDQECVEILVVGASSPQHQDQLTLSAAEVFCSQEPT